MSYTVSTVTRSPPSEDIVSREQSELTQNILFNTKICGGSHLLIKVYLLYNLWRYIVRMIHHKITNSTES